jgi:hypothetical protein
MDKVFIVSSDGWQPSVYSSSRSDFTAGVSIISTGTEATFTTGASATTVTISSNRNTASRWLSSQIGRAPADGVQRVPYVVAEALTPRTGALQRPDADAQDLSGLVQPAPVVDHPKPPPRTDKVELTIDSLQNYELLKPIRVVVESLGDKVFVAEAPELNVSTSGTSVGGALILLKDHVTTIYEGYTGKKNLDSERARQFKIFETYIGRPKRNWM